MHTKRMLCTRALTVAVLVAGCSGSQHHVAMTGGPPDAVVYAAGQPGGAAFHATTSTTLPPPPTTVAPRPKPAASSGAGSGYSTIGPDQVPCGGPYPACCVVARESGGVWTALNPVALSGEPRGAGGAYQFIPSTWWAYGGTGYADQASPAEQMQVAARAWADWPGHWYPRCW